MENVKKLSCKEANKMDMVDYLATIGHEPKKIRNNDHWYISPFRDEHTPSFKIDRRINKWYDHGEGKGGTLVDFGIRYYKCSIADFLSQLDGKAMFYAVPIQKQPNREAARQDNRIEITAVNLLTNPALLQYGESRHIDRDLLQQYCREINYTNAGKSYFGIGFANDLGGYELRSKYFKGSSSPKGITHLKAGQESVNIFEGFFNFLSFQQLQKNAPQPPADIIILNSLSFFEQARPVMESYRQANLYLDNNAAGQKFTEQALSLSQVYQNKSPLYKRFEDLNDFLRSQSENQTQSTRRKTRLRL